MSQPKAFTDLRETPLHAIDTPAAWEAYYAAMSPWLEDTDADIRHSAVERLCTAIFWSEGSWEDDWASQVPRVEWFIGRVDEVAQTYPAIIGAFLFQMRFSYPKGLASAPMENWLGGLIRRDHPYKNMARGTLLVNAKPVRNEAGGIDETSEAERIKALFPLLDDSSDYVRACAAYAIGAVSDEAGMTLPELFAYMGKIELTRPGIAGAFWTGGEFDWCEPEELEGVKPITWMMDLLENRAAYTPAHHVFNDIAFHLHEISAGSPDTVRRMIKGGELDLALETACEIRGRVEGMEAVLMELGAIESCGHAPLTQAWAHLAQYYAVLHPDADSDTVKRSEGWEGRANGFAIRYGAPDNWSEAVILHPLAGETAFTAKAAWAMIDSLVPPETRGALEYNFLDFDKTMPPKPYVLGNSVLHQFGNHIRIDLLTLGASDDMTEQQIQRIDIYAPRLNQF